MKIKKYGVFSFKKEKLWVKIGLVIGFLPVFGAFIAILATSVIAYLRGAWGEGLLLDAILIFLLVLITDVIRPYIIVEGKSILCVDYFLGFRRRRSFTFAQIHTVKKEYYPQRGSYYSCYDEKEKRLFWVCCSEKADEVFGEYIANR